jgi:ribosomal protein S5
MAANLAFRAFMTCIGVNDMTTDAIGEQGVETMENLAELTLKDVRYLSTNVMKYQAPLVAQGKVRLPFRSIKKIEAARYWIDTRRWT